MGKFDTCIGSGEAPVDRGAAIIAMPLPSGEFAAHLLDGGDAPVQALAAERAQFDFG